MAETLNSKPQIMEKVSKEEIEQIVNTINQKLEFATNPKFYDLKVLPYKFMTIPSLQRFGMAPYKFRKIETKYGIAYFDGESLIIYNNDSIELYIKSRNSRKIYRKIFYDAREVPDVIIPHYGDLTNDNVEYMLFETSEELANELFSLKIELLDDETYKQGHLYAIKVLSSKNIDIWFQRNEGNIIMRVYEIYGHKLTNSAYMLTDEIYFYETDREVLVEHNEHGTNMLPQGKWLLYHPKPRNDRID